LKEELSKEATTTSSSNQMELSPCLRLLPLETWIDVFGFVRRDELARLVPDIGHWHFATKAQYFLHEYGKITLGCLRIDKGEAVAQLIEQELPLATVPLPKNITNFETLRLKFVFILNLKYLNLLLFQLF
jgi:hypothetical protein